MRISDWSSDVCSSDLAGVFGYLNSKKDAQNAPTPRKPAEIIKFDEPDETWVKTGGLWTKCVFVGPENCPDSPVGIAIKADGGVADYVAGKRSFGRSEEHTSELQSLMRITYAVFCLNKKKNK